MIIRHKRFMDICFEPSIVYYSTGQIMGKWINMGYIKSWYLDNKITSLFIDNKKDWEKCTDTEVDCLRYTTWEPL